jgi:hypothetical protein
MWCFFEEKNQRKSIIRLGEEDYNTTHTERLLMLNNYALAVGYDQGRLPYNDVSCPRIDKGAPREYIGFNYVLPELDHVSNPTEEVARDTVFVEDDSDDDSSSDDSSSDVVESTTTGLFGDESDVDIAVDDSFIEDQVDTSIQDRELELLSEHEVVQRRDRENRQLIQSELAKLMPYHNGIETTLQAFRRLTDNAPWIPFRMPNSSTRPTDEDLAEAQLFDEWEGRYKRVRGNDSNNYHAFARDWNNEAARRLTLWSQGDESVVQIRLKSTLQLCEYYDARKDSSALQVLVPTGVDNDPQRKQLNSQLHVSRQSLPPTREAEEVSPTRYVNNGGDAPFGCPAVLNATIAVGAVEDRNNNCTNPNAPFRMALPNIPQQPVDRPVRRVFRSRRYCVVCCYRRNEHGLNENAGKDCVRNHCGNCRERYDCHEEADGWGPTCVKPTHPWSDRDDWWEIKVCYLL